MYTIGVGGDIPNGGGSISDAFGGYEEFTVEAASGAGLSVNPFPPYPTLPVNLPEEPIYMYGGTFTVSSSVAPTNGCFYMFTTTDGTDFGDGLLTFSGAGLGFPNDAGLPPFTIANLTQGTLTALNLSVYPNGTGSGTFTLSDGDSGTITITGVVSGESPALLDHLRSTSALK
ncbi:MAG TPA: hypothetical protein VME66_06325 [Candidatus Acidoferrales bacterium]|nr:hypothetical protein [Candidatus Acidoferrales bacterium]